MQIEAYKVNKKGLVISVRLVEVDKDYVPINADEKDYITVQQPQPNFYIPKWDNEIEKWTEGMSQEEIDELNKPQDRPLTDIEVLGQQMVERELEAMTQGQQITDIELKLAERGGVVNV
ncbi:hypothetical protein [Sporosarcina limicola]|uniref:Uncharacterized protein n=1 Tax=Sporosarcina limicola TaxID=34101 RepID=A0A927MI34_9BACL|nr:hypothetical protein [Sporosarcina limicola]MBE1554815.1 hypothetical protein [Sporosarcina limicola]